MVMIPTDYILKLRTSLETSYFLLMYGFFQNSEHFDKRIFE